MGNSNSNSNYKEIAYGMEDIYLIKRCDIICKYWIQNTKILIPFDIIKLISLFCKNTLKFTLFHPNLIKGKLIKINNKLNEIEIIQTNMMHSTFICDKNPIHCKNGSFQVKIIRVVNNMYIGLINGDFSKIKQNITNYHFSIKGIRIVWDNMKGISCYQNGYKYYKIECNVIFNTGDLLITKSDYIL